MKNESLVNQVLEIIITLIEASEYMYKCIREKKFEQLESIAEDMLNMLQTLIPVSNQIKVEIPFISAPISCENIIYSINNILKLVKTRSEKACSKIEFELIPILQDFYYDFYFFTCIFGDKEKEKKHNEELNIMTGNRYIDESMKTGEYKYDISIAVLAYNKLEYTKKCIESIIKYTPSYINYELILIDNGSSDGTSEYFESLSPTKVFKLKQNSINIVIGAVSRIYQGKYLLSIANDVIVTENYLDNLIECIESDSKIAMIVPTTPNVSNIQTIPAQYSTLEEMHIFAKENNVSDPSRWEERTRLCNPLSFSRSDVLFSSSGVGIVEKYFIYGEFCDDSLALKLRRAGYKMILAKDCYCYHFGSVTLGEGQVKENTLEKSRKLFIERYGVDAWSTGFCYDVKLMEALNIKLGEKVNILGINSGFGSNPLKIKTLHKEAGNQDVQLYFMTNDERYVQDLKAYSDNVRYVNDGISNVFNDISFDYILLEGNIENIIKMTSDFNNIKSKLVKGGTLGICATSNNDIEILNKLNASKIVKGSSCSWFLWDC